MQTNPLRSKFAEVVTRVYGKVSQTKAALRRLAQPTVERPGTADTALQAMIVRDIRRSEMKARRKNTRGLPLGYSIHEARRARALAHSPEKRERATETELQACDVFITDEEACNKARKSLARPSKLARRVLTRRKTETARELSERVTARLRENVKLGRVPYHKPVKKQAAKMVSARVRPLPGGAIEVTPQPLSIAS